MTACAATTTQTGPQANGVIATTDAGVIQTYRNTLETTHLKSAPAVTLDALRTAYTELGVDVGLYDPSTGQVGNKNFVKMHKLAGVPLSQYFGCGDTMTGPAADDYSVTMSLISRGITRGNGLASRYSGPGARAEHYFEQRFGQVRDKGRVRGKAEYTAGSENRGLIL